MKQIIIPYSPQPYQREIHDSLKRFKVVKIGRRGGKTELLENEEIKQSVKNPGLHWIVAPTYRQVKAICWKRLKMLLKNDTDWKFNEAELSAHHPIINTTLELKGADNEDSLRGVGLKSVGIDEAASLKPHVWPEIIRPMLADSRGPALFIGTPKGKNWFFDLFMRGQLGYSSFDPEWQSWGYPTSINRYIAKEEIEQARKDMSERLFRQEFMAEFLDDETGVFKKIRQCIVGDLKAAIPGHFYVMGVDLAKTVDFTVLVVIDVDTREVVAFKRFQNVMWTDQKGMILDMARRYNNALTIIDSTGVGDPICEDLRLANISLYYEGDKPGYKFTNDSKARLIDQLAIAIEQRLITFPSIDELINELMIYEYFITDAGRITYGAPEGKHDDCVTALALAVWAMRNQLSSVQIANQIQESEPIDKQGQGELVIVSSEISRPYEYHVQ